MGRHDERSVKFTGAEPGSLLIGIMPLNLDAIIQVLNRQPAAQERGEKIRGPFVVLAAGRSKKYAKAFELFLNRQIDADEFLTRGRRLPGCSDMTYPITSGTFMVVLKPSENLLPEELLENDQFPEGAVRRIVVNAYERNPEARARSIAHYGARCVVCGFDFESVYGFIGAGYIHVHHIMPLSSIKKSYIVDPLQDLRPVCPNCHAMLHAKTPVLAIEELRAMIDDKHRG